MRPPLGLLLLFFVLGQIAGDRAYAASAESICGTPAAIFCDDFENEVLPGIWEDGYNSSLHSITSTPTNVYRGQKALQATYPAGSNGAGWLTRWFMPGYDHTFARLYLKLDANWQCAPDACGKVAVFYGNRLDNQWSGFGQAGVCPSGTDYYYAGIATVLPSPGNYIFYSYYPGMPRQPDGVTCWGTYVQFTPQTAIQPGVWTCLEFEVQGNTPGSSNGFERVWINDVLRGEVLNRRWRDTTNLKTNAFQLTFSASPAVTSHMWVDNIVVSTERIGCLSAAGTPPTTPTGLIIR
jgi:hypothetical protein